MFALRRAALAIVPSRAPVFRTLLAINSASSAMASVGDAALGAALAASSSSTSSSSPSSSSSFPHSPSPVDESDFARIMHELHAEDEARDSLIKKSRDIQKLSKNSIYEAHRGNVTKALAMVEEARAGAARDLLPPVAANPHLRFGAVGAALEEWVEAVVFSEFIQSGRIMPQTELGLAVTKEEYLGGVMDVVGEVGRHAVLRATVRDTAAVGRCRVTLDALNAQLMLIDWRNGNLRRKYDAVKYSIKKIEGICYDLSLAGLRPHGGGSGGVDAGEPNPAAAGGAEDGGDDAGGGGDGYGNDGGEGDGGGGGGGGGRGGRGGGRGGKRPRPPNA
jgi:predicted translin family RNA/ssDNA-binding protein